MKSKSRFYFFVAIIIVMVLAVLVFFLAKNKAESEIVSANYPDSIPTVTRDDIAHQLRNLIEEKFGVSDNGTVEGEVRQESYQESHSEDLTSASFLIDIDLVEQTYLVNVVWSNTETVSDGVVISCPPEKDMKYRNVVCQSMYDDSEELLNIKNNPLYNELPLSVEHFDFASRTDIKYEIRGYFQENKLVLSILDYSGNNYDNAIKKIRELGYNPDDYQINYIDQSQN